MSDIMRTQPFAVLLNWILTELAENQSVFGIPRSLFYLPKEDSPYAIHDLYGQYLATPIGPGAGPHTQLAQNIVCAWLSGGRFMELKTVQIMDELEIPRPCIDMEDEGYNVEWSQELKLEQSASEYVKAWVLIHVLRRMLGFEGKVPFGTVFNMSVGYNLEGIQSARMVRFMGSLEDASEEIAAVRASLKESFPQFGDVDIPSRITNNVTLSTMHGCPPDEIERIGRYLLQERGLHTTIKLNPTLLGKEAVMTILHDRLGFGGIHIPDRVFEHDLQYERAVELIEALKAAAAERGLTFGVKLSNTLAMANQKGVLAGDEVYMSGRALYPITINLFHKLCREFDGDLNVSFSAGADALNLTSILAAGGKPVTAVSDVLKPGGYSRFGQYLENLERDMHSKGATNLEELARDRLANLEREATRALEDPRYRKGYHPHGLPKVASGLGLFDCVVAPCVEQCAVLQDVPEYAWLISHQEYDRALEVILSRNPLPGVTGFVCTHVCQTRCTRNDYDEPVAIRALKRFATERGSLQTKAAGKTGHKVAVIGSGPSGLAAGYFLALNGIEATIYEARDRAGGMLALAPAFRLPEKVVREDIDRIKKLGVRIELSHPYTASPEALLDQGFDAVYVASGAQKGIRLGIAGEDGTGVFQALDFLGRVSRGEEVDLGDQVVVIGGGNSAMDAARTARRLVSGQVTVVYRRTRDEMPATEEEVEGLFAEGVTLLELASPRRIVLEGDRVASLECIRNELGAPEEDGRRRPIPVEGSAFQIAADSVVVAVGQRPDVSFLEGSAVAVDRDGTIVADPRTGGAGADRVYAGGDAVRGPDIIIAACADGRRAAEAICHQLGVPFERPTVELPALLEEDIARVKRVRTRKEAQHRATMLPPERRAGFDVVEATLVEEAALAEANRCMQCSTVCDKCVEVCPNRANYAYRVSRMTVSVPRVSWQHGSLEVTGEEVFRVDQPRQIIHVDDFCNECGNCATFCVHEGRPYLDKPRLFLDRSDFEQEDDNAFYVEKGKGGWAIRRREAGRESRLVLANDAAASFEDDLVRMSLSLPDFGVQTVEAKKEFQGEVPLVAAVEMYVILEGVRSLCFLPFD